MACLELSSVVAGMIGCPNASPLTVSSMKFVALNARSSFVGPSNASSPRSLVSKSRAPSRHSSRSLVRCKVAEISEAAFEQEVLKSSTPVLVDFWATWCGPCRLIVPVVEWAAKEYEGKLKVVKMEVDANPAIVEQYKVYGLPTVIIFDQGQVVPGSHREGALTKAKLKDLLADTLPQMLEGEGAAAS